MEDIHPQTVVLKLDKIKQITQEQIKGLLNLLQTNNIGVQDIINVQTMFEKLPDVEIKKEAKK